MAAIADPASFRTARLRQDLARRFGLTGFWHWWLHELSSLVPGRVRAAFERRRARPVLAFDGARAVLCAPVRSRSRAVTAAATRSGRAVPGRRSMRTVTRSPPSGALSTTTW